MEFDIQVGVVVLGLPVIALIVLLQLRGNPTSVPHVRLAGATVAACVSVIFVFFHTRATAVIAHEHGLQRPAMALVHWSVAPYASLVVVGLIVGGRRCLRRIPSQPFHAEALIAVGWLFALSWSLGSILAGMLQGLPLVVYGD